MTEPVLACRDVVKRYGGFVALDGVSLSVAENELLGIAGPNGAGKTTLFDVLSGHARQDRGEVELNGRSIGELAAHRRARLGLARTFQSPLAPDGLTVGEVLRAARLAYPPVLERGDEDVARELSGFEVGGSRLAAELDALARRRLLLCCLIMRRPRVLLLDEPCSGLLPDEIAEIEAVIRRIAGERKLAVVVIEHRLELLEALAGRLMVLHEGRVLTEGSPAAALADPDVRAVYFGAPAQAA